MLAAADAVAVHHVLLERLSQARDRTDELFDIVRPDSLYERPIPERHRIIFYLGHLEAFDWNLLRERLLDAKAFHPELDRLFAFGIDPVGSGLPSDQPSDWPAVADVRQYVKRIRQCLDEALARTSLFENKADNLEASAKVLLNVAIEHRLMHAETLTYMLHQLPLERKIQPSRISRLDAPPAPATMLEILAGRATLGLSRDDTGTFGWDNEHEAQTISVPAFAIDRFKVTNGQYLEFIAAGAYEDRAFWTNADWQWKTEHNVAHPAFWHRNADRWQYRAMFDHIPLPLQWPVYVSHAEAGAYARWAGKALPTEAQWHRAAYGTSQGVERQRPWGDETPGLQPGNFDFANWDPTPVGAFPAGQSAFGVADMLGNGWEWTSSLFEPFPGFQAFPFYRGYSADFFDGKHYVMKGGSARTAACLLRRSFRNWFQAHYQYVYAGFRCVSPDGA